MASPPLLLVAVFVGLPVLLAVAYSLGHTGGLNRTTATIAQHQHVAEEWWGTLGAYREMFANERFRTDLALTLMVTVVSTVITLLLAVVIGLLLRLRGGWAAQALALLAVVPMFVPVVISAWAILTFFSGPGLLRSLLAQFGIEGPVWAYSPIAICIGQVWTNLPFAVLMTTSGFQSVPDAVLEAARDAGAPWWRVAWSVLAPMAFVQLVIAGTFTAIGVVGSFTVPYFTGPTAPTMLGVDIVNYFQGYNRPQQAIVHAVVIFVAASVIAAAYVWANFHSAAKSRAQ